MFNLGAEGIFYISGIVAAILAIHLSMNGIMHPIVAIGAGSIVGALLSAIPGYLKAKWNANELVTSLMFNSIFWNRLVPVELSPAGCQGVLECFL